MPRGGRRTVGVDAGPATTDDAAVKLERAPPVGDWLTWLPDDRVHGARDTRFEGRRLCSMFRLPFFGPWTAARLLR
ncbi:MAG: hypothetical protein R3C10_02445 [Pirellulales bacterium]